MPTTSESLSAGPSRSRWLAWLGCLGIFALFIALRWNNYNVPLLRDEGEYAYAAQLLKHGLAPYEHSFLQKPPMIIYTYALSYLIAPNVFWFPRVMAGVFTALATVLLGFIARREFGPGAALPAMWLMTPLILLPRIEQYNAATELFLLLPLLATVFVYVRSRQSPGKWTNWFWAGELAAVTFFYKYTALPILAFVFLIWAIEERRAAHNFRQLCRNCLCGMLGGLAVSLALLGFFLIKDGGKSFWECTILFNRFYAVSSGLHVVSPWVKVKALLSAWWIVAVLLPFAFARKDRSRVWFWTGLFLAACVSTGGTFFGHYYILVMPFVAMLSAVAITNLAVLAERAAWQRQMAIRVLTIISVLLLCVPDASSMLRSKEEFADEKMKMWHSFLESPLVAKRVAELTSPEDYVYIAGSEPQILYYARRYSPTRFVIAYPLMISTPLARDFQREAIRNLQDRPPALIVLARSPTSWLKEEDSPKEFDDYLKKLFTEDYSPVGAYVPDANGGRWEEPLPQSASLEPSLVLFKRKSHDPESK